MAAKINFNGQEFDSVDDMPPQLKLAYQSLMTTFADKDGNGMPDIFEGKGAAQIVNLGSLVSGLGAMKMIFDGKEYSSMQDLPPEAREKYQAALEKMKSNPHMSAYMAALANGKTFSSIDQLPPELKDRYEAALEKMRANPNLSAFAAALQQDLHPSVQISTASPTEAISSNPVINPAPAKSFFSDTAMLLIGVGIVGVLALVALFVLVLFLFPSILK